MRFYESPDHRNALAEPLLNFVIPQRANRVYAFTLDKNDFVIRPLRQNVDLGLRSDAVFDDPVHLLGVPWECGPCDLGYCELEQAATQR
ncbi:hypothetical protein D3C77_599530 [compost metagenome]